MSLHEHLLEFSFSPALSRNSEVVEALRKAIAAYENIVATQPWKEISIKDAYSVASELIGTNIHRINRTEENRLCFEVALVSIFANTAKSKELKMDKDEFVSQYPEFKPAVLGETEIQSLLDFRNMMVVALRLIPGKYNKGHLLEICTRLIEGHTVKHVTGSGQKPPVQRRVTIYERESGIIAGPRPPRRMDCGFSNSRDNRKRNMSSVLIDSGLKIARGPGRPKKRRQLSSKTDDDYISYSMTFKDFNNLLSTEEEKSARPTRSSRSCRKDANYVEIDVDNDEVEVSDEESDDELDERHYDHTQFDDIVELPFVETPIIPRDELSSRHDDISPRYNDEAHFFADTTTSFENKSLLYVASMEIQEETTPTLEVISTPTPSLIVVPETIAPSSAVQSVTSNINHNFEMIVADICMVPPLLSRAHSLAITDTKIKSNIVSSLKNPPFLPVLNPVVNTVNPAHVYIQASTLSSSSLGFSPLIVASSPTLCPALSLFTSTCDPSPTPPLTSSSPRSATISLLNKSPRTADAICASSYGSNGNMSCLMQDHTVALKQFHIDDYNDSESNSSLDSLIDYFELIPRTPLTPTIYRMSDSDEEVNDTHAMATTFSDLEGGDSDPGLYDFQFNRRDESRRECRRRARGKYKCKKCGQLKTNHVCTIITSDIKSKENLSWTKSVGIQVGSYAISDMVEHPFITERTITVSKDSSLNEKSAKSRGKKNSKIKLVLTKTSDVTLFQ